VLLLFILAIVLNLFTDNTGNNNWNILLFNLEYLHKLFNTDMYCLFSRSWNIRVLGLFFQNKISKKLYLIRYIRCPYGARGSHWFHNILKWNLLLKIRGKYFFEILFWKKRPNTLIFHDQIRGPAHKFLMFFPSKFLMKFIPVPFKQILPSDDFYPITLS
jgi:hypothetical protein